ncbi:hypothetical protein IMSAGC022_00974 [Alistipes sp.]|nr:hypothetical protein IMSAGC022_00974 [Alistipes sp.]
MLIECRDDAREGTLRCGRVAVQTRHASLGKQSRDLLLDLLRAEAHIAYILRFAVGTGCGRIYRVAAVVALQPCRSAVQCKRDVAVRTARRPTALPALDIGGITAPVLKQHDLLAGIQRTAYAVEQRTVEVRLALRFIKDQAKFADLDDTTAAAMASGQGVPVQQQEYDDFSSSANSLPPMGATMAGGLGSSMSSEFDDFNRSAPSRPAHADDAPF